MNDPKRTLAYFDPSTTTGSRNDFTGLVMRSYPLILFTLLVGFVTVTSTWAADETPLTVEAITCTGNSSTDCSILTQELRIKSGDVLNQDEINSGKIRLQLTGLFKQVDVALKKGSARGKVNVEIAVVEGSNYFSEFSLDYLTLPGQNFGFAGGDVGTKNLLGSGKILHATFDLQKTTGAGELSDQTVSSHLSLEYADPHLFNSDRYFFTTGLAYRYSHLIESFKSRYLSAYYDSYFRRLNDSGNYQVRTLSPFFNIGRRVGDFSFINLEILREYITTSYTGQPNDALATNYIGFRYGWNDLDDVYFPTHGSIFNIGAQLQTGYEPSSDFPGGYQIFIDLAYRRYWAMSDKSVLNINLGGLKGSEDHVTRVGLINPDLVYSVGYSYDFAKNRDNAFARNGRLNLDFGTHELGHTGSGFIPFNPAIKLSVDLEVPVLGILNLGFIAESESR